MFVSAPPTEFKQIGLDDQRARLIEPVKKRSRHIICTLCTSEGIAPYSLFVEIILSMIM